MVKSEGNGVQERARLSVSEELDHCFQRARKSGIRWKMEIQRMQQGKLRKIKNTEIYGE